MALGPCQTLFYEREWIEYFLSSRLMQCGRLSHDTYPIRHFLRKVCQRETHSISTKILNFLSEGFLDKKGLTIGV